MSTGYSCSCPPFECVCPSRLCPPTTSHLLHPQSTCSNIDPNSYWLQEPLPDNTEPFFDSTSSTSMSYDFSLTNELFQPEEIFQLDQPLRANEFTAHVGTNASKSPTTLLDLGSGTIHRSTLKKEPEPYWMLPASSANVDDSNSSCRVPQCSPGVQQCSTIGEPFREEDCSLNRMNFNPDAVQRMSLGFMNFHFDENKDYPKFDQPHEDPRLYSFAGEDENRFHSCEDSFKMELNHQTCDIVQDYSPYIVPEIQDAGLQDIDCQLYQRHAYQSESSQETFHFPQSSENNFFQSLQYQNQTYMHHISHH